MTKDTLQAIRAALAAVSSDDRRRVFQDLRKEFPIHDLERKWNAPSEVVLEAIARATDLTQRGLRGVIAEAAFAQTVVVPLLPAGWTDDTPAGDIPFDFRLNDKLGTVKVQVKNQRNEKQAPKLWKKQPGVYVAETQKTRSGKDKAGNETRPYRFGEFDILAVCLHPSTNDWSRFVYTVGDWLLPREKDNKLISVFQPVDPKAGADWTTNFITAVSWYRSGRKRTIAIPATKVTPL
ncbi:MAG TPA: hypothetical protein VK572_17580 [Burkholderiales bacterium]|nr:hypothetical protein [Burkholderiales bacterium]